jgi:hypothetical protein
MKILSIVMQRGRGPAAPPESALLAKVLIQFDKTKLNILNLIN